MAYKRGKMGRPMEYASKTNHSLIIKNPNIKEFLKKCDLFDFRYHRHILPEANFLSYKSENKIKYIFAVDGSFQEIIFNEKFPSKSLAYFNIGVLPFDFRIYENIESSLIVNPSSLNQLKNVTKKTFIIPTKNIKLNYAVSLIESVRISINEVFSSLEYSCWGEITLNEVFSWLIFEKWHDNINEIKMRCINSRCDSNIVFNQCDHSIKCKSCGSDNYLIDYLNLHDLIDEVNGASGIVSFLCNVVEQLYIIEGIRKIYYEDKKKLSEILFIKDGALAFFSKTFKLNKSVRNLIKFLNNENVKLNLVGLEKSGPFIDHAENIKNKLEPNAFYILDDTYIRKYIQPQVTESIYGFNTYYGKKVLYKTKNNDLLIAVVPVKRYEEDVKLDDFISIDEVLKTVGDLRCSMYDNAVVPVVLINKLVSLSVVPGSNILKSFTRQILEDTSVNL